MAQSAPPWWLQFPTAADNINFLQDVRPVRLASDFRSRHAEEFVRCLRSTKVAPNGHPKARKRLLRDSGIKFILETCSSLFNYAQRCRHLSPYAENPFRTIEVSRMPVEDFRPVIIFTEEQEQTFFKTCDDWQFPLFLTFLLTGMRRGNSPICCCRMTWTWKRAGSISATNRSLAGRSRPATNATSRWCPSW